MFTTPRVIRIEPDGSSSVLLSGGNPPWNGIDYHRGDLFLVEGGTVEGGRIVRLSLDGRRTVLAEGLPSFGDHHTNGPCKDARLTGVNAKSKNPLSEAEDEVETGAFSPFGKATTDGQVIPGAVPCTGSILRVRAEGGPLELVAWGLRNPFGLAFHRDGRLFATDNSYDARGSRPVFGSADLLWQIDPGAWYGWPDYADGRALAQDRYAPPGADAPRALLLEAPNPPPYPKAFFGVHSSSNGFAFSTNPAFGYVGEAFVAQFGDRVRRDLSAGHREPWLQ